MFILLFGSLAVFHEQKRFPLSLFCWFQYHWPLLNLNMSLLPAVTVNAVAPGFIATEMMDAIPEELKAKYLEQVPMHRFADPEEVANTVVTLCSGDFSYLTGQTIVLDGGLSL